MHSALYALGFSSLDEETTVTDLPVEGAVPEWLRGQLFRTGPARFEVGKRSYKHWFDGLAMLYKFSFDAGRISYSNRYLRGESFCESMERKTIRRDGFATTRDRSWLEKLAVMAKPKPGDNCNVNVVGIADSLLALTETPTPVRFDGDSLETLGRHDYGGGIKGQISTAHPHFDYQRQCLYNYILEFGPTSHYHLYSVSAKNKRQQRVATIPVKHPAYMHSFAMSERYLILTEFPLVTNSLRFLLRNKPFIHNYRWEPHRGTLFHVVDKDSGTLIKTALSEPFFAFHHVNAFERGGELVLDVAAYPDASIVDELYLSELRAADRDTGVSRLLRYRIDLHGSDQVSAEPLADAPLEFPRIDYTSHSARPYRYVYGAGRQPGGCFVDNLLKVDTETGGTAVWHEADCYPGEPVFVAGASENNDVVLSVVLDTRTEASFLLVLDAATFTERARARLPHPVPFGFHGNFFQQ